MLHWGQDLNLGSETWAIEWTMKQPPRPLDPQGRIIHEFTTLFIWKVCSPKKLEVCAQVPTMVCTLVPYTDCKQTSTTVKYNVTTVTLDESYVPFKCVNETRVELETKIVPKCVNVTRQDCVTKWELNSRGEKVRTFLWMLIMCAC